MSVMGILRQLRAGQVASLSLNYNQSVVANREDPEVVEIFVRMPDDIWEYLQKRRHRVSIRWNKVYPRTCHKRTHPGVIQAAQKCSFGTTIWGLNREFLTGHSPPAMRARKTELPFGLGQSVPCPFGWDRVAQSTPRRSTDLQ